MLVCCRRVRLSSFRAFTSISTGSTDRSLFQHLCTLQKQNKYDELIRLVEERDRTLLSVDNISLAINAHCKRNDIEKALDLYQVLKKQGRTIDMFCCTPILSYFYKTNDTTRLRDFLFDMLRCGTTPPTSAQFILLLNQYRMQDGDQTKNIESVIHSMERACITIDFKIYNLFVNYFLQIRNYPKAVKYADQFIRSNAVVDTQGMNSILNAYIKNDQNALPVCNLIVKKHKTKLDGNTYGLLIQSTARFESHLQPLKIFRKAKKAGFHLGIRYFNVVLRTLSKADPSSTFNFFLDMEGLDIEPNAYTYSILIESALQTNDLARAAKYFGEANRIGKTTIDAALFTSYIKVCIHVKRYDMIPDICKKIREQKCVVDNVFKRTVIVGLEKNGKYGILREAMQYLGDPPSVQVKE